jgi:hypothetical protein
METTNELESWATAEVASTVLNDVRNVARLRAMLVALARTPDPCVAAVYKTAAARDAAYDFLAHPRIRPTDLVAGLTAATAGRAAAYDRIYVPIDGSSLTLSDPTGRKGLGAVGARRQRGRGLKFVDALAVGDDGVPLGLLGLEVWARPLRRPARRHEQRPIEDKESGYWLTLRAQARARLRAASDTLRYCFLLDSDADHWAVLCDIVAGADDREDTIVRSCQDRRATTGHAPPGATPHDHLYDLLAARRPAGTVDLEVTAGPHRRARTATLAVTFAPVTLDLLRVPGGGHVAAPLWAVRARECSPVPAGETPLEWILLTTIPVTSLAAAIAVCRAYGHRWRCEDFHKTVKGGDLDFESTQQQRADAIVRWFVLHATVALRVLRLTYLARQPPDAAATTVVSPRELEALTLYRTAHGLPTPARLTVGQLLPRLASLGGYTGGARRLPGPKVLGRALHFLDTLAEGLRLRDLASRQDHREQS